MQFISAICKKLLTRGNSLSYSRNIEKNQIGKRIMKKFKAHLYQIDTGERKTIEETSRDVLVDSLATWLKLGWHVESFS
jgi:hypothetical protein